MNALLRYGIAIFASYFVAWTAAYTIVTYYAVGGIDFSQYFTWLMLAWNFTGFEMVAITCAIFIPLVVAAIFLVPSRARGEQASPQSANRGLFGR